MNARAFFDLDFNSIKVRLEQAEGVAHTAQIIYFNSIKVRLEHSSS